MTCTDKANFALNLTNTFAERLPLHWGDDDFFIPFLCFGDNEPVFLCRVKKMKDIFLFTHTCTGFEFNKHICRTFTRLHWGDENFFFLFLCVVVFLCRVKKRQDFFLSVHSTWTVPFSMFTRLLHQAWSTMPKHLLKPQYKSMVLRNGETGLFAQNICVISWKQHKVCVTQTTQIFHEKFVWFLVIFVWFCEFLCEICGYLCEIFRYTNFV